MEALELTRTYWAEVQQTRAVNMLQQAQLDNLRDQNRILCQEIEEMRMTMNILRGRVEASLPAETVIIKDDEETVVETIQEVEAEDGPVDWDEGQGWDEVVIQQSGLLVEIQSGEDMSGHGSHFHVCSTPVSPSALSLKNLTN